MATTARLALSAWRNDDVYEVPIRVRGVDLTDVALAMQVRLAPDTPGPALIALAKVTNGNAQGLRVAGVATVDGVPESDLRVRINRSTLQAMPYAGEMGDGATLSYALLIAGRTRLVGPLTVLAHAFGSDAAPASRPAGQGAHDVGMPAGGALLTIVGEEVCAVTVDGTDLIAGEVDRATTAADAAGAFTLRAELAASTALASSRYFASRALGEAGSAAGQAFSTDDGAGSLIFYKKTATASTEIARAMTPAALAAATGSSLVGIRQSGSGSVARRLDSKVGELVSVMDFGAKGDGVTDDTAAFDAAIATGKTVSVPCTAAGYAVSGIRVVDNMQVVGEKSGMSLAPMLIVSQSDTAAFYNDTGDDTFHCVFENLACGAGPGVTGASFYSQSTTTKYSAYFTFREIETHLSLRKSYVGLFIFALWDRCRDGYLGSPTDTEHSAIIAVAGSYGQTNQQNICRVRDTMFFNAYGGQAAIVLSYGVLWTFDNVNFEQPKVRALVAYNVFLVRFSNCWFEAVGGPSVVHLALYPNTAAASMALFDHCHVVFNALTNPTRFVTMEGLSTASFRHNLFTLVPAGTRLADADARIAVNEDNTALSGDGTADFFTGSHHDSYASDRRCLNGASDNGVPAMSLQNGGGISATGGFLSRAGIAVATGWVTIATSRTGLGGTTIVSGYDPAGGAQFRLIKDWQSGQVRDVVPPLNATGRTVSFQMVGDDLRMKVDAGSIVVFTTMMH